MVDVELRNEVIPGVVIVVDTVKAIGMEVTQNPASGANAAR
jgi:hypothetical protein